MTWAFLTGEYPPQRGGVADYTHSVATALAVQGDAVHVWAPQCADEPCQELPGPVHVHRLPGFDRKSLLMLSADLAKLTKPLRLLVQYVPQAFGWKGMNVPFCFWLSRQEHPLWVTFHEVRFPFLWSQSPQRNLLAAVTRIMSSRVARAAERILITIPAWGPLLPKGTKTEWLPVPSNFPSEVDPADVAALRLRLGEAPIVGHFGTYGELISPLLSGAILRLLAADSHLRVLLLGHGSERFAASYLRSHPQHESRLIAGGSRASYDLACHLAACDVVMQPYPDGVSSRRTTLMASLALGLPIVTTSGPLTEALWEKSDAVVLAPVGREQALADGVQLLLADRARRDEIGRKAKDLHQRQFSLERTIQILRS
jgi:glycosyltransferase involved in cell wall biosynthesis